MACLLLCNLSPFWIPNPFPQFLKSLSLKLIWNSILRREGLLIFCLISRACSVELSPARKYLHERHAIQDWTQAGNCPCKRQRNRTTVLVHLMFQMLPGQPEVKGKLLSSSTSKNYFRVSIENGRLGKPCENIIQTSPGQYPSKAQGFSCLLLTEAQEVSNL